MALTDYEELAARSFDAHHDPEVRAAVQVCADALSQIDDPRGPLISFEYALAAATTPRRALELRRTMYAHAAEHAVVLLGDGAAPLLKQPRGIACEWRSGMLYGVAIDARYIAKKARMSVGDLVRIVLKAPAAGNLRSLRVRVREPEDVVSVITMLGKRKHPLPLEEIEIGARVWPQRIHTSQPSNVFPIREKYPNLYYLATSDLMHELGPFTKTVAADVLLADEPTSVEARLLIGRALTSIHEKLREAAYQRIAEIGPPASVFARILRVMLQPSVLTTSLVPIIEALGALGPSRENSLVLAKISSRTKQYSVAERKAAGVAAAATRLPSA